MHTISSFYCSNAMSNACLITMLVLLRALPFLPLPRGRCVVSNKSPLPLHRTLLHRGDKQGTSDAART